MYSTASDICLMENNANGNKKSVADQQIKMFTPAILLVLAYFCFAIRRPLIDVDSIS